MPEETIVTISDMSQELNQKYHTEKVCNAFVMSITEDELNGNCFGWIFIVLKSAWKLGVLWFCTAVNGNEIITQC